MSGDDRPIPAPIALRRFTSSAWATAGVSALLALAARTTGAGWLIVILCLLLGALAVGTVWPRVALRRLRISAVGPRDATAGRDVTVDLRVTPPRMGVLIRAGGADWRGIVHREPTAVTITPERRGRYMYVDVEVVSGEPFGMSWARRHARVPLEREMLVAPRTAPLDVELPTGVHDTGSEHLEARRRGGDQLRSVREYAQGDPLRHVHWPATARRGELLVKEFETPGRRRLHVSVDLSGDVEADERTCERAMAVVAAGLASGFEISLGTRTSEGGDRDPVRTIRDAGRRLAVAVRGAGPGPADSAAEHLCLRSEGV